MQRSSGEMARGARVRLPDPPRPNPSPEINSGEGETLGSAGLNMLRDPDTNLISSNETSPSRFRGASPIKFSSGSSLSAELQCFMDLMPPISPSAPFSQMNLDDSSVSPMIPGLSLVEEEEEDYKYDGTMFSPLDSGNR